MPRHTGQSHRADIEIKGLIQGVGFRPFIYQLAAELGLSGQVQNTKTGVRVVAEGPRSTLELFIERLSRDKPPHALIEEVTTGFGLAAGEIGFQIEPSQASGLLQTSILPDLATCSECREELDDPNNRRYRYPFISCLHCGPRYTIIDSLPYDRERTAMRSFPLCAVCRHEYDTPENRRFHAQTNACWDCGPQLELWERAGQVVATRDEALREAAATVDAGKILALKGLGGFHLIADACDEGAVELLRWRKNRPAKPFAVMYPSLISVEAEMDLSDQERELLQSEVAPIVLLRPQGQTKLAPNIAPRNPTLGLMLPYTPLHALLLQELGRPLVATSGNLSEEPLCVEENEALLRLKDIADMFLVHNRPIRRPVDDSIMRVLLNAKQVLRRARGLAPHPVAKATVSRQVLAVGGHLKNTVAMSTGSQWLCSQHHGDLEAHRSFQAFERSIEDLTRLHQLRPDLIVSDKHPDYRSTRYARATKLDHHFVQHHYAHVLSGMTDNQLHGPVLGVAWDGGGYGDDGTIWGGEFLQVSSASYRRVARLRTFRLPGGEAAVRDPRRSLFGLLYALDPGSPALHERFTPQEHDLYGKMIDRGLNAPLTSSIGRLFDAVAALLRTCDGNSYEGQAAMSVEFAAEGKALRIPYDFDVKDRDGLLEIDWGAMLSELLCEGAAGESVSRMAGRFHATCVEFIVAVAERIGEKKLVLTGGCFQNAVLTECAVLRLREKGFEPYWHHHIPPNDGGISVGQLVALQRGEN